MRAAALRAVLRREFAGYFGNPTGYVFITVFVFLSALAAFWQERFFQSNLANLDPLNAWFPYLLIFLVPSITMGLWADERRHGTEELLLTLPASGWELVAGKYLAALGIYTVALVFSLSHVAVLAWLGSPDPGLISSTYLGYWLMGMALLPIGLLASLLTANLTVAFICGSLLTAFPVFLAEASNLLGPGTARAIESLSVPVQFRDLSHGIVTPQAIVYFLALALAGLSLCIMLVERRRWPGHRGAPPMAVHVTMRGLCAFTAAAAATVLAGASTARLDVTSEQIHTLANDTRKLIAGLDPNRPVFIQAYFSPEVPRSYIEAKRNLTSFLREFDAIGQGRIETRIVETVKFSPEAREARERYGIVPVRVATGEETRAGLDEIFLALVFTCGSEESVVPAFDRGLPVEYELMRSIRVVSGTRRRKIGILDTGARLFGGFDFSTKRQSSDWPIVEELRKQYEVVKVPPDGDYPDDMDVLMAVQPGSLNAAQLGRLSAHAASGRPVLFLFDPLPLFEPELSPRFGTSLGQLLKTIGVDWRQDRVVWDTWNPHPQLRTLPPEVVFVGRGGQGSMPFQEKDVVSAGLQEMVMLYPGLLKPRSEPGLEFTPLLTAGKDAGETPWAQLVTQDLFGGLSLTRVAKHDPTGETYTLAARVKRSGDTKLNAIVIADADFMAQEFFELRKRGVEGLNFDNVSFILNAVDDLAGDRSFIALRKRRPRHRTLEALEARTRQYEERRRQETEQAAAVADQRLKEAQARLDAAVRAIESRGDLDDQTRQIMISSVQTAESRRLQVARANIEDEREKQIENARISMESSVRAVQNTVKLLAISLPPVPAFLLAILMSLRRLKRERVRVSPERLVEASPAEETPEA